MNEYSMNRKARSIIRVEKALKQSMGISHLHIEFIFSDNATEVTTVRCHGTETHTYPVCPSCGYGMEREYQQYCEVCGQRLLWNRYEKNKVILQRIMGCK